MKTSRRDFLRISVGTGLAITASGLSPARLLAGGSPAGNALRMPPQLTTNKLTAMAATREIWPGSQTGILSYNGTYLAPTIRTRTGQKLAIDFLNNLNEPTTIHWHGIILPAEMDGHPMDAVAPGASFRYEYDIIQRPGTYWYHPHPHGMTGKQVYMGMAGLLIVEGENDEDLGLPPVQFDLPLVLQDRITNAAKSFEYAPTDEDLMSGVLGDAVLVNGTPDPYLEVENGRYRFRLLNGSNARIYKLALEDGAPFHIIGSDGGLLDRPYEVTSAWLSPGERLEILVDFSSYQLGASIGLKSLPFDGGGNGESTQGHERSVLRFDIARPSTVQTSVPATLVPIEKLEPGMARKTRTFEFSMNHTAPRDSMHLINGKSFEMMRVDEEVTAGDIEIWEFTNTSDEPHPVHAHGVQFQVLERLFSDPMTPTDYGWKDTVLLPGNGTVRVIMRFPEYTGMYLLHCHNLEHEDTGMMLQFEIMERVSGVDSAPTRMLDNMDLR